ncbi:potassium voltage-gated channel subfamily S member 2-like [Mercenaria mercenaria]|uniref:potassium voltage-gated channel subfamily S member 2-like n=1 Tax=Mercenaria mercenaria TaxID=6596 RepID=UPI00234F471F|nr:potassium voltage-gated channel subfamily S member 2-like [Mercenaria mercenaria]
MDITEKETVRLNIGGTIFKCCKKTLNAFPGSKLDKLDEQKDDFDLEENEFYFDRNPLLFAYILDAFRKGAVHIPNDSCGTTFKKELEFWEIPLRKVAPCCLEALYRSEDDIEKMDSLMNNEKQTPGVNVIRQEKPSFRKRLWLFLDDPSSSRIAQVWSTIMSFLVLASTFTDALSTVSTFQQNFTDAEIRSLSKVMILFSGDNTTVQFLKTQKPNDILIYESEIDCDVVSETDTA